MTRLFKKYKKEVVPALQKEFGEKNPLAIPKVTKIIVNIGVGSLSKDKKGLEKAADYLAALTGQKPSIRTAKKAISDFGTREGSPIGLMVTLRRKRMYQFLDKLFSIVLPRVRDFQGVSRSSFDRRGNYTLGLKEQIIFPEVDYDKIDKVRGLEITIVTNTKEDRKAARLLELIGMPFVKAQGKPGSRLTLTTKGRKSG